ncbi:hypothetical protein ACE10Z_34375 [Bradyrhizobium sp. Pha-3]|uniref:hypothetical protein n=1 Tax=Bradyrhizobium sp. Pha-3 TaxID=208375 RepID=UPI0035D48AF9
MSNSLFAEPLNTTDMRWHATSKLGRLASTAPEQIDRNDAFTSGEINGQVARVAPTDATPEIWQDMPTGRSDCPQPIGTTEWFHLVQDRYRHCAV